MQWPIRRILLTCALRTNGWAVGNCPMMKSTNLQKPLSAKSENGGRFSLISDFVNRRTGSDKELAVSGTVQSALDSADVSINAAYRSRVVNGKGTNGLEFPEAESGPLSQGIPGIVKQGDILTPVAPFPLRPLRLLRHPRVWRVEG